MEKSLLVCIAEKLEKGDIYVDSDRHALEYHYHKSTLWRVLVSASAGMSSEPSQLPNLSFHIDSVDTRHRHFRHGESHNTF